MKRILSAAIAAALVLGTAGAADAKFSSSSRSFSYSSSFSRPSSSWSAPSSYSVRSTTYSSVYRPSPASAAPAWRSAVATPTTINHTVIVNRQAPVIVRHYGGGYGGMGFWHGMMLGQMFGSRPAYVGGGYAPGGVVVGAAPAVGYGYGWSPGEIIAACLVAMLVLVVMVVLIRAALRDGDD